MVDWEITATTIYCEDVDDEVTLLISADGTVKCTGRERYTSKDKDVIKAVKKKSKLTGKRPQCRPGECRKITEQVKKHLGGESKKP
jgi:hypothetical protein